MTPHELHQSLTDCINAHARIDREQTGWCVLGWMQEQGGGQPHVALLVEEARSDARFWAETASPVELECYMLAAVMKMSEDGSTFHGKNIKRLIASLWKKMSPTEQAAFMEWAGKNRSA